MRECAKVYTLSLSMTFTKPYVQIIVVPIFINEFGRPRLSIRAA